MTDRRETNRPPRHSRPGQKQTKRKTPGPSRKPEDWSEGERIAKYLARAGISSRREAEALIEAGEVRVNGRKLTTPAFKVTGFERIEVNGKPVKVPEPVRVWRYHKPAGLITTTSDPEGRSTIFEQLPKTLPRVVTIGRLDLTTEGLLLLTNDGGLARAMELPKTGFSRRYRARAHGQTTQEALDTLKTGVTLEDGTRYTTINAVLERETGSNNWIDVELTEGKNREVRKALEHLGLQVNRLIRIQYGPFELGDLRPGAVEEISPAALHAALAETISADFLPSPDRQMRSPRPPAPPKDQIINPSRAQGAKPPRRQSSKPPKSQSDKPPKGQGAKPRSDKASRGRTGRPSAKP